MDVVLRMFQDEAEVELRSRSWWKLEVGLQRKEGAKGVQESRKSAASYGDSYGAHTLAVGALSGEQGVRSSMVV
jgi:hypothetical protein